MQDPNEHKRGPSSWWDEVHFQARRSRKARSRHDEEERDDEDGMDFEIPDEAEQGDAQEPVANGTIVKLRRDRRRPDPELAAGTPLRVVDGSGDALRVKLNNAEARDLYPHEFEVARGDVDVHIPARRTTKVKPILTDEGAKLADGFASSINRDVQQRPLLFGSLGRNSGQQQGGEVTEALQRTRGEETSPQIGETGVYLGQNTYAALSGGWQDAEGNSYDRVIRGLDRDEGGRAVPGQSYRMEELEAQARLQPNAQDLRKMQESTYIATQSGKREPLAVSTGQITPEEESKGRNWHAEDQILYSVTFQDEARRAFESIESLMDACQVRIDADGFKIPFPVTRRQPPGMTADVAAPEELEDGFDDAEIDEYIITDEDELERRRRQLNGIVEDLEGIPEWNYDAEDAVADLVALDIGGMTRQITLIVSKYTCQSGADKPGVSGGCQAEVAMVIRSFWDQVANQFGKERAYLMEVLAADRGPLQLEVSVAGSYAEGPARDNDLIRAGGILRMHMSVQFEPGGAPVVNWIGSSAKYAHQVAGAYDELAQPYPTLATPAGELAPEQMEAQRADEEMWNFVRNISAAGHARAIDFCVNFLRWKGVTMSNAEVARLLQGVDGSRPDWPRQVYERLRAGPGE